MKKFINLLMSAASRYGVADFAFLKMYVCAVGIILGMYFSEFFLSVKGIVWAVAVLSGIVVVARLWILSQRKK